MIRTLTTQMPSSVLYPAVPPVPATHWRQELPVLHAGGVTLRELRLSDASSLHRLLTTQEVSRFISPPPSTVTGSSASSAGRSPSVRPDATSASPSYRKAATPPSESSRSVSSDPAFEVAEWGFAIGAEFWGTGLFAAAAPVVASSRSTRSASGGSKRAPQSATAAATARCRRSARCARRSSDNCF